MTTEQQRLNTVLFYAAVLLIGYLAFTILQPFLAPLAWAGVLALCAFPLHQRLARKMKPPAAALVSTLLVALVLILPTFLLGMALIGEAGKGLAALQRATDDVKNHERVLTAWNWLHAHFPMPTVDELKVKLMSAAAGITKTVAGQTGALLQNTSVFFFKLFITLMALFFFLRDSGRFGETARRLLPFEKKRQDQLLAQARDLVYAGTMTTLTVAVAQGTAGGIIFAFLGITAPIFWGVVMCFCALIPLFGTTIVWIPAAIGLAIFGHWIKAIILVACGIGVIGMIDNVLRPLMLSGKASMNGLIVFISLLGGVAAFGFLGLVLGPVVTATALSLLQTNMQDDNAPPGPAA